MWYNLTWGIFCVSGAKIRMSAIGKNTYFTDGLQYTSDGNRDHSKKRGESEKPDE
jgi:hypothetical protein